MFWGVWGDVCLFLPKRFLIPFLFVYLCLQKLDHLIRLNSVLIVWRNRMNVYFAVLKFWNLKLEYFWIQTGVCVSLPFPQELVVHSFPDILRLSSFKVLKFKILFGDCRTKLQHEMPVSVCVISFKINKWEFPWRIKGSLSQYSVSALFFIIDDCGKSTGY